MRLYEKPLKNLVYCVLFFAVLWLYPTWAWYRRANRPLQVVLGCGTALLLLCVCFFGIGVIASAGKPASATPTAVAQGKTPTPVPTSPATPKPTATPTPAGPGPVHTATFGGREDDFIVKYGQPIFSNNNVVFHFSFTTPNGKPGVVVIQMDSQVSSDGKPHVSTLTINTPSSLSRTN
jgi:hypothetical protein